MIRGADIICFSCVDWDFLWQADQEIASRLAAAGNRVLFVENTGVRAPTWRDLPRIRQRIRNWRRGTKGFRMERDNLFIYSPVILPFPYSRLAQWINRILLMGALKRWMRAVGFQHPLVWTFLPTPLVREVIRRLDPALLVYYCVDDMASSSRLAQRIGASETSLLKESDLVFVTSERLQQRAARHAAQVHCLPSGVDYERFEQVRLGPDGVPEDLRSIPAPIAGYVGGLHQWVDQELLEAAAQRLPRVNFVLVGPEQCDVSRLRRCPNIHFLGTRSHALVPGYLKGFTVGLVPYRLSDYTANVYPMKLNEYLAMGIPVVATDLHEIRRFNKEHGAVVAVAGDAGAFADQVQLALTPASAAEIARRTAVAKQNSWEARMARMAELVEQALQLRHGAESRWQESLYRLYRTARHRAVRLLLVSGLTYAILFWTPLVWWLGAPLRVAQPPRQADAIVVFGGGVGESGIAGQGYEERVQHAVNLWKAGYAPTLLLESGTIYALEETQVMTALAVSLGVPKTAIQVNNRPGSTYEMVRMAAEQLRRSGRSSLLLVSSPYHMRRASLVFRKQAPDLRVTYTPIPDSMYYSTINGISVRHYRGILHEYVGMVYYAWKGYLALW